MGSGYAELESIAGEKIVEKYDYSRLRPGLPELARVLDIEEVRRDLGKSANYLKGNWWCTATGDRLRIDGLVEEIDPNKPENLFMGKDEGLNVDTKFSLVDLRMMERIK